MVYGEGHQWRRCQDCVGLNMYEVKQHAERLDKEADEIWQQIQELQVRMHELRTEATKHYRVYHEWRDAQEPKVGDSGLNDIDDSTHPFDNAYVGGYMDTVVGSSKYG